MWRYACGATRAPRRSGQVCAKQLSLTARRRALKATELLGFSGVAGPLNATMHEGSLHFGELPLRVDWYEVRDHILRLPRALLTKFLCDGVTEAWVDFAYEGRALSINDRLGACWFFAADPTCPERLLRPLREPIAAVRRATDRCTN